jgi:hypothetical protein
MELNKTLTSEMDTLKGIVEKVFMVDILDTRRRRELVDARMAFCKIMRDRGAGFTTMGKYLGKTHATIIHYIKVSDIIFKMNTDYAERFTLCKTSFMDGREVMMPMSEREKEKTIDILNKTVNDLYLQSKEAFYMKKRYGRLVEIIELLDNRIRHGKEDDAYKKICAVLNGL